VRSKAASFREARVEVNGRVFTCSFIVRFWGMVSFRHSPQQERGQQLSDNDYESIALIAWIDP
jgi:hypothetical protein